MNGDRKPFHEKEYRERDGFFSPILEICVGKNGKRILAYVDTGCSSGIALLKDQVKDMDLGVKISDEPSPCVMADGHIIAADEYVTKLSINGEEREAVVSVIDPTRVLGSAPVQDMEPLLGREFLDGFDVLFKGKEKKIAIFKC